MLWMAVLGAILLWFEVTNSKGSLHKTHAFQISPKPCWVDGYEGTCMFVWECIKSEGYHIGMCVDTFMFGSCCAQNVTSDALLPHYAIAAATGQPGNPAILYTSPIQSTSSGGGKPKPTSRPHATKLRPVTPLSQRPSHTVATSLSVKQSYRPMMSTDSFAVANNLPGWQTTTEPGFITNHQSGQNYHQSGLKPLQSELKPLWHITTEPGFVTRVKAKPGGFKQKPVGGPKPTKKPVGEKKTMKPLVETKRPPAAVNSIDNERMPQQNPQPLPELIPTSTIKSSATVSSMANTDCGIPQIFTKPQMRIVGGKIAPFGRWPWQVSVRRTSFFGFSSTHRCGGAVLNENWIATAGHCVDDLLTSQIRIRVGEHDFSSVQEQYPYVERAVSRKIVHPKYNFYTYEYDLALVQLEKPLEFAPHILPVCLPASDDLLIGENATVTGWGRLSEGGTLPSILQEVQVPIVSNERCKSMFLKAGRHEFIPEIFLCAGYDIGGQDSCQGDSGGPLQVKGKDGRYFLAGIISWGIGCAEANLPGVCTRISKFVPWILKNVT